MSILGTIGSVVGGQLASFALSAVLGQESREGDITGDEKHKAVSDMIEAFLKSHGITCIDVDALITDIVNLLKKFGIFSSSEATEDDDLTIEE